MRLQRSLCYGFQATMGLLAMRGRMPVLSKRQQLSTVLLGQTLMDPPPSHCRQFHGPLHLYGLRCPTTTSYDNKKKLFNSPAWPWLAFGLPEIQWKKTFSKTKWHIEQILINDRSLPIFSSSARSVASIRFVIKWSDGGKEVPWRSHFW